MSGISDVFIKGKGIISPGLIFPTFLSGRLFLWLKTESCTQEPPLMVAQGNIHICSGTFSVQVFELSLFSKAIYGIGVCRQACKVTHAFTSKSMPRQHILNCLVNWAPESEC